MLDLSKGGSVYNDYSSWNLGRKREHPSLCTHASQLKVRSRLPRKIFEQQMATHRHRIGDWGDKRY